MKEMREYPGFLGTERSQRGGSSLEMKPGARVACQVTMAVVFLVLLITAIAFAVHAFQPRPQPCARCPFDWIGYRGKCYYFSEAERNWTSSQDNCSALGASLAMFDSMEDLSFTMRYKGISEHWVGLSREGEEQPWKWVNRSRPSPLFQVQGGGFCAYLGDTGLHSSQCSTERNWVCTKPALNSPDKGSAGETWDLCTANSILGRRVFEEHLSSETVGEGVTVRIVGLVAALLFLVTFGKQQHEKRTPGTSRAGSSQQAASSKSSPPVPPPGVET
ncbi:C-type lectin domain family 2 member D-like [Mergus octosetaceus]